MNLFKLPFYGTNILLIVELNCFWPSPRNLDGDRFGVSILTCLYFKLRPRDFHVSSDWHTGLLTSDWSLSNNADDFGCSLLVIEISEELSGYIVDDDRFGVSNLSCWQCVLRLISDSVIGWELSGGSLMFDWSCSTSWAAAG